MKIIETKTLKMTVFDTKSNTSNIYESHKDSVEEAVENYVISREKETDNNPNIKYMRQTFYNVVETAFKNGEVSYKVFAPFA